MKLYLLRQYENRGYDTYDSCIVCADNEEEAKKILPNNNEDENDDYFRYRGWTSNIDAIECTEIGFANSDIKKGLVLSSFNAG